MLNTKSFTVPLWPFLYILVFIYFKHYTFWHLHFNFLYTLWFCIHFGIICLSVRTPVLNLLLRAMHLALSGNIGKLNNSRYNSLNKR